AMSCGLPVVTSDRGALSELVRDRHGGFVCRGNHFDDFSGALMMLLDDANLRRTFGSYNRQLVERCYRWDLAAARVHAIYDDLLARRRAAVAHRWEPKISSATVITGRRGRRSLARPVTSPSCISTVHQ